MALKTIRLYGKLGALFGRVHKYDVLSPAEAVKAMCVTLPGFQQYLMAAKRNGMSFSVLKGMRQCSGVDDLKMGVGKDDIRIAPMVMGSKRAGAFQTILGAVLVVVGVAIGVFSGGALSAFGYGVAKFGGVMLAGGLYQMLSPQTAGLKARQDTDNEASYAFGGPVNTTVTGICVPILYGTREIGGAIISAGIVAEDISA